jgi:hypothetical protein
MSEEGCESGRRELIHYAKSVSRLYKISPHATGLALSCSSK